MPLLSGHNLSYANLCCRHGANNLDHDKANLLWKSNQQLDDFDMGDLVALLFEASARRRYFDDLGLQELCIADDIALAHADIEAYKAAGGRPIGPGRAGWLIGLIRSRRLAVRRAVPHGDSEQGYSAAPVQQRKRRVRQRTAAHRQTAAPQRPRKRRRMITSTHVLLVTLVANRGMPG